MVFECVHNHSANRVEVFQSFNAENDNQNNRLVNVSLLTSLNSKFLSGKVKSVILTLSADLFVLSYKCVKLLTRSYTVQ